MTNLLYAVLSHSWSGLLIATPVLLIGWLVIRATRRPGRSFSRLIGWVLCLGGLILATGSVRAISQIAKARREFPPLGRLVDVGGYRMHILAEGDAKGGPTLIWIPGSHDQGLGLYHLHKALRGETRSIIFDRPGSGWSDPGPYPRRTAREADELATLLANAGETGPFIPIGHSYGGLLAANFARRYPENVAALVLLDPSPPDAFVYAPVFGATALEGIASESHRAAVSRLFGLEVDLDRAAAAQSADVARIINLVNERLSEVHGPIAANNLNPATYWSTASIFKEFSPDHVLDEAPNLVVYDGELGDLPVYLVTPDGDTPGIIAQLKLPEPLAKRALNFFTASRVRYLEASSRSELIHAPAGTGHNYPYETPEFVVETVRRVMATARDSSAGFAATQSRGQAVMGVDQYTSAHVFEDLPDGGRVILDRDDPKDTAAIATIRRHMADMAADFRRGEFTKPFKVHDQVVPGTDVMAARRSAISYAVVDRPRGGEVRLSSADPAAVTAIHQFLSFQRGAHHAAGHEHH